MRLVSIREAAKELHTSYASLHYWINKGFIKRYPIPGYTRQVRIDLDEAQLVSSLRSKRLLLREDTTTNLLTPEEAADYMGVVTRMISYYVKMNYLKAHYVLGNNKFYLVDRHEIDDLIPMIEDRRRHVQRIDELKEQERNTPKDANGKWMKRSTETASVK